MRILEVLVPDAPNISEVWDTVKIYRANSRNGTYTALERQIPLSANRCIYKYVDPAGLSSHFYKFAYSDSTNATLDSDQFALAQYYCQVSDLKDSMGEENTDYDRLLIQKVEAATNLIRQYCGRGFEQVYETRYFTQLGDDYPPHLAVGSLPVPTYGGCRELDLLFDDLVSVDELVCDYSNGQGTQLETWTQGTDFFVSRLGGANPARPFNQILVLPISTSKSGYFPRGYRSVKITGTWGWPTDPLTGSSVPAEVRDACLQIATRIFKGKDNGYSRTIGNNDINGTQVLTDRFLNTDATVMLDKYRRIRSYGHFPDAWSSERV